MKDHNLNFVKKVIFNPPATIVLWGDGTKTVVKCQGNDEYCPEHGLAMCICKKFFGNKGNFNEVFKKHCPLYEADCEPNWITEETVEETVEETKDPALYNGKIKCVSVQDGMKGYYTLGKVYEVVNGRFIDDDGLPTPPELEPAATCLEELLVTDITTKFIEVEE